MSFNYKIFQPLVKYLSKLKWPYSIRHTFLIPKSQPDTISFIIYMEVKPQIIKL